MKINSFSVGSAPNHDEDFLKYVNMGIDGYAVVIADGMGGLRYGEIASKIACTTILSHIQVNYRDFHSEFKILKEALEKSGLTVETGRFRTHMEVSLVNDGPVTILLDSRKGF